MMNFALDNLAGDSSIEATATTASAAATASTATLGRPAAVDSSQAHRKPHSGGMMAGGLDGFPRTKSAAVFTTPGADELHELSGGRTRSNLQSTGAMPQRAPQLHSGRNANGGVVGVSADVPGRSRRSFSSPQPESGCSSPAQPRLAPSAAQPVAGNSPTPSGEGADGGRAQEEEGEGEEGELQQPPSLQGGPTCWHDVAVTVVRHPGTGR